MAGPGEAPARAVGGRAAGSILLLSRKSGVTSGYASKIGSHASGPGGSFAAASIISPRVGLGSLPSERDLLNPGPASSRSWLRRSGAAPSSAACVPAAPLLATWHLRAASLLPRSHHHPPRFYRCARPGKYGVATLLGPLDGWRLCHMPHFTDTAARSRAQQPRHRTLAVRSSTLATGLSPCFSKAPGVSRAV